MPSDLAHSADFCRGVGLKTGRLEPMAEGFEARTAHRRVRRVFAEYAVKRLMFVYVVIKHRACLLPGLVTAKSAKTLRTLR